MDGCAIEPDAIGPAEALRNPISLEVKVAAMIAAALAIAIQTLWIPIDADVSWLITVCERVLSGERLYIDILEVNPPASVWLYLPLVWLAQTIGARPEAVVAAGFVAGGLASAFTTLRIASRLDRSMARPFLACALPFIALVLPMALFAQREHAAVLLALPVLAALAVIAEGGRLNRRAVAASGFAAGLIVIIKPYFLLAVAIPALWTAWKRRSVAPLVSGLIAGGLAIALYAVGILVFAPAYFAWLPVIAHTYGPMHESWWKLLLAPTFYPAICIGLLMMLRPDKVPVLAMSWILGAAGFLLATFAQAKNYPNHLLPEAALALAAAAAVLDLPGVVRGRRLLVSLALAFVGACQMYQWMILPDPAVASAIKRVAPPTPSMIALSPQLTTGHPVTRNVDGRWVGSRAGLFTASGAAHAGLKDPIARDAYREDVDSFGRDVAAHSPDVVLVSRAAKKSLMREPSIAAAMSPYRPAAVTKDTEIWVRRSLKR
jgi:hypothetical protein